MRFGRLGAPLLGVLMLAGGAWPGGGHVGAESGAGTVPLSIAPPPGWSARPSAVPPFETVSSPYLRMMLKSYQVALKPQQVYAYYLPRLEHLGYRLQSTGTSGNRSRITSYDWAFTKGAGMNDTVLLTVEPDGAYSLARELVVAPARPKTSIVPAPIAEVTVRARRSANEPWVTRTLRTRTALSHFLAVANALPMDTRGAHGCLADFGAAATVRFIGKSGSWTFAVDPACGSVLAPGGTHLMDQGLWTSAAAAVGFPATAAP